MFDNPHPTLHHTHSLDSWGWDDILTPLLHPGAPGKVGSTGSMAHPQSWLRLSIRRSLTIHLGRRRGLCERTAPGDSGIVRLGHFAGGRALEVVYSRWQSFLHSPSIHPPTPSSIYTSILTSPPVTHKGSLPVKNTVFPSRQSQGDRPVNYKTLFESQPHANHCTYISSWETK